MKVCFLLNPTRVRNRWDWREMAARYAKRFGWTPRFGEVDRNLPRSSERCIEQALEEGCTRVIVIGGDGSLHRTVNALSQMKKMKTEIAVVPAGTCNDYARSLGLSRKKVDDAFRLACSVKAVATDLALMDKELFLNNAGFGRKPAMPGKRPKPFQTLKAFNPVHLKATWDKGAIEGSFYMALICNAPYFSGGLHFSKNVSTHDGLLDVYLIPVMPKWKLLPVLALGRLGRPTRMKRLITLRVPRFDVETSGDIWPQADGEPHTGAVRRVSFAVSPEKAMIVTP